MKSSNKDKGRLFYLLEPIEISYENDIRFIEGFGLYPSKMVEIKPLKCKLTSMAEVIKIDDSDLEQEILNLIRLLQINQEKHHKNQERLDKCKEDLSQAIHKIKKYETWMLSQVSPILKNYLSLEAYEDYLEEKEKKYDYDYDY